VSTILVTGMSGTGKSTVLAALADRGIRVVDLDTDEWSTEVASPDGSELEQVWREAEVAALLASPGPEGLVVSGCASNQGTFYDRFDDVVLLSAPVDVILERIRSRTTSDFGKDPTELRRILDDVAKVQPILQRTSTVELDATAPVAAIADRIEGLLTASRG
jgi:dephospho-CoA kinase